MTPPRPTADRLVRFVHAQADVYESALEELGAGRKRTHWMWFVFPQLTGLGQSETARFYGIADLDEARAYLAHPLLGPRLRQAVTTAVKAPAASLRGLFGYPDDLKMGSCLTLFAAAAGAEEPLFRAALKRFGRDPEAHHRPGGRPHRPHSSHGAGATVGDGDRRPWGGGDWL